MLPDARTWLPHPTNDDLLTPTRRLASSFRNQPFVCLATRSSDLRVTYFCASLSL